MEISWSRMPVISIWLMRASPSTALATPRLIFSQAVVGALPVKASRSSRTSSARARKVRSSVSAVIATLITWFLISTSEMIGFSTLSAKFWIASTRLFTSLSTLRTSLPEVTSTVTKPMPSAQLEVSRSMPSRSWIASSIGTQTPFSTSSGVAFG